VGVPIHIDNDFSTWNRYGNRYWPAMHLIDKRGVIRHVRIGESRYQETEGLINRCWLRRSTLHNCGFRRRMAIWQVACFMSDVIGCESLLKYFPHIHNTGSAVRALVPTCRASRHLPIASFSALFLGVSVNVPSGILT
jgi:hypothetical protein